MRRITRLLTAAALFAASTLIAPRPASAAITVLSSTRTVAAATHAPDGSNLLGLAPRTPDLDTSGPAAPGTGPFDYSTGLLVATGRAARNDGGFPPSYSYAGPVVATSAASFYSNASPWGLSAYSSLSSMAGGWKAFAASAAAHTAYSASFTVDVPTPFLLTARYSLPPNASPGSAIGGTYHFSVLLTGFSSLDLAGSTQFGLAPTTYSVTGVFQPGNTYTLLSELDLTTFSASLALNTAPYAATGTLDFSLVPAAAVLASVPEPAAAATLGILATGALLARRDRTRVP